MGKANGLSRRPDWKVEVENDNDNQVVIKDNQIHSLQEVVIEGPEVDIIEKIKKARGKDKEVVRIVEQMKKAGVKAIQGEEWKMEGKLVLKEGKVYMPKDEELRTEIIWLHHDVPIAEYGRKWKMVELVTRNYWWLEMTREVRRYVEECDLCQQIKNRIEKVVGKLKLEEALEKL